ncbi:MAG: helix-turn-helix domain-containing protein [Bacteroidales bacterium]|nr:helix-turn-helix domain-containing protein [Bacteroidales bacterium]
MELENTLTQFFDDIIRPIVTSAVEEVIKRVPAPPSDDLITVKEACHLLKCSPPTFYCHVNDGTIKLEKNGRNSLVHKGKLLADLDAGKLRLRNDKHRGKQ